MRDLFIINKKDRGGFEKEEEKEKDPDENKGEGTIFFPLSTGRRKRKRKANVSVSRTQIFSLFFLESHFITLPEILLLDSSRECLNFDQGNPRNLSCVSLENDVF